jgi:hypothetical protein
VAVTTFDFSIPKSSESRSAALQKNKRRDLTTTKRLRFTYSRRYCTKQEAVVTGSWELGCVVDEEMMAIEVVIVCEVPSLAARIENSLLGLTDESRHFPARSTN